MFRVNLKDLPSYNDYKGEDKMMSIDNIYIKMRKERILLSWKYKNDTVFQELNVEDSNWLTLKSEPFVFERDNEDSTYFNIIIKEHNMLKGKTGIDYKFKGKDYSVLRPKKVEYKAMHQLNNVKMIKVYFEFDQMIFNTIEYYDVSNNNKITFMAGMQLVSDDSLDFTPDINNMLLKQAPFYFVVRDEDDKLIPIEYFMIVLKIN